MRGSQPLKPNEEHWAKLVSLTGKIVLKDFLSRAICLEIFRQSASNHGLLMALAVAVNSVFSHPFPLPRQTPFRGPGSPPAPNIGNGYPPQPIAEQGMV